MKMRFEREKKKKIYNKWKEVKKSYLYYYDFKYLLGKYLLTIDH